MQYWLRYKRFQVARIFKNWFKNDEKRRIKLIRKPLLYFFISIRNFNEANCKLRMFPGWIYYFIVWWPLGIWESFMTLLLLHAATWNSKWSKIPSMVCFCEQDDVLVLGDMHFLMNKSLSMKDLCCTLVPLTTINLLSSFNKLYIRSSITCLTQVI